MKSDPPSDEKTPNQESEEDTDLEKKNSAGEIFEEGRDTVFEDEGGNVLAVEESRGEGPEREKAEIREGQRLMHREGADKNDGVAPTKSDPNTNTGHEALDGMKRAGEEVKRSAERPGRNWREGLSKMSTMGGIRRREGAQKPKPQPEHKEARGPARAYQYGNTIIVEDEDGEVIKKYDIPAPDKKQNTAGDQERTSKRIGQMGKLLGLGSNKDGNAESGAPDSSSGTAVPDRPTASRRPTLNKRKTNLQEDSNDDDERIRFNLHAGGRRMSKVEFINHIRDMDPKSRVEAVEDSDAPEAVKREARKESREQASSSKPRGDSMQVSQVPVVPEQPEAETEGHTAEVHRTTSHDSNELKLVDSSGGEIPIHDISSDLQKHQVRSGEGESAAARRRREAVQQRQQHQPSSSTDESAAERRRRQALQQPIEEDDSEDDGTERVPPSRRPRGASATSANPTRDSTADATETAAERRRRMGALGISKEDSDSEDNDETRDAQKRQSIRFAEPSTPPVQGQGTPQQQRGGRQSTLRWGKNVGR